MDNQRQDPKEENKFNFEAVKKKLESMKTAEEKIDFLRDKQTEYLQSIPIRFGFNNTFDKQCEYEIENIKRKHQKRETPGKIKEQTVFKISERKGAKIDLIRVLNALYELQLINKTNGQIPTKQEFFETMGEYLGVDLSKYHTNLSQALQNQPLEVNLKVFEDMKSATQKAHHQTKNK